MGVGAISDFFSFFWDPVRSSYYVALFSIDVMVCAWSYGRMLCHVSWMSVGGLLFSELKCRDGGSGGEER